MNNMYKIKIRLTDIDKIKKFIKITNNYKSDIDILTDSAVVEAKSILGVHALNLSDDTYVRIISDNVAECRKFQAEMKEFKSEV